MSESSAQDDYLSQVCRTLDRLFKYIPDRPFAVRLPDGTTIDSEAADGEPSFTLVLNRPAALRRMFLPPNELGIGESYIFDDYNIEGDMVAAFRFMDEMRFKRPSPGELLRLSWELFQLERSDPGRMTKSSDAGGSFEEFVSEGDLHSVARDIQANQFHYDLSNDFYRLWLDERMVYSCAYFTDPDQGLAGAQQNKLDLVCRRLNLQQGERFLDIGCGWGGLLIYAVQNYGVKAHGISLSEKQTEEALNRIEQLGLSDRCQVTIQHYEEIDPAEPFDKIASVGMLGHVGEEKLPVYFAKAFQLLRPGGLFCVQGGAARIDRRHVGRNWMDRLGMGRNAFMQKYSFPDTRLIDIPTVLMRAEEAGFETREVESLREHYPLTLDHWLKGLEANEAAAVAEVGQAVFRAWRLVLAGYLYLLERGSLAEYQSLLAKPAIETTG